MAHRRPDDRPDDQPDEPDEPDELPPAEAARARRRDHDAGAAARAGMRTGLAKQFKQVLDAQAKRARSAIRRGTPDQAPEDEVGREPAPRKRGRRMHRQAPPE